MMKKLLLGLLSKLKTFALGLLAGAKNIIKNHKLYSILAIVFVVLILCIIGMSKRIGSLKNERDKYKSNEVALLTQTTQYKTKDSLNAASVYELQMTSSEYKKCRADDAKTIQSLQTKGRRLESVIIVQGQTHVPLNIPLKDSIINKPNISQKPAIVYKDTVKTIKSYTDWYYIDGVVDKSFTGNIGFNEKLGIIISIQYKRFLGFLWHTSKIKNKKCDVVNYNPFGKITKIEYITFK
jgi:hypothetical protein